MFAKIIAFLAVAVCAASAATFGCCYPGYGAYCNTGGVAGGVTRVLNRGCESSGIVSTPVFIPRAFSSPVLTTGPSAYVPDVCNNCRTYVTPLYKDTVGCPEVYASCENSVAGVRSGF